MFLSCRLKGSQDEASVKGQTEVSLAQLGIGVISFLKLCLVLNRLLAARLVP
jgi:hypothetical protein